MPTRQPVWSTCTGSWSLKVTSKSELSEMKFGAEKRQIKHVPLDLYASLGVEHLKLDGRD